MTRPTILDMTVGSMLQAASPPESIRAPVIIAPALTEGDLNDAVGEQLEASLRDAMQKSDIEVVKVSESFGRRAVACGDDTCRAELMAKNHAGFLLVPKITLDDKDYHIHWRKKANNVKQGSSDEAPYMMVDLHGEEWLVQDVMSDSSKDCLFIYNNAIKAGVCPEQARMILPQNTMTTWI